MKRKHAYITVLAISLLVYFAYEVTRPKPIDWSESYSGLDKIPYGCFIMRDMLPELFPHQSIHYQSKPIFSANDTAAYYQNAIFINSQFAPDKFETEKLLNHVKEGKNIFISAKTLNGKLADTLGIETASPALLDTSDLNMEQDSIQLKFTTKAIQQDDQWYYPEQLGGYHFTSFDTTNTTVLGIDGDDNANYIKTKRGDGAFYIHTIPYVFTNYFMRNYSRARYSFRTLSHLPVASTLWDEYYKAGRAANQSPMRYIVSHQYLRWAWITTLAGLFIFIIFRAKRRERIIPDIEKPKNTTLEFTKTIGRLYHQSGDHKDMATKKIQYFMEYIRDELNLETTQIDSEFKQHLAQRASVDIKTVASVFAQITHVQQKEEISSRDLWELNQQIETFYQQSSR